MHGHAHRLAALLVPMILLAASCGPGQHAYLDRVQLLAPERAHPLFREVLPLMEQQGKGNPDDLMRTWKDFLGDAQVPLRQNTATTFVYYDFTGTMSQVFLEASFAPGRFEPLWRVGSTGLFFKTYDIFKPDRVLYRFSDGTHPLIDPFNPDLESADGSWQRITAPDPAETVIQRVVGASESALGGQDLSILLPQAYDRNLSWTYPFLVVVGLEGQGWSPAVEQLLKNNAIRPVIVFSLEAKGTAWSLSDLKSTLESRVVPWIREHYRVSSAASDMTLVAWGRSIKVVQDLAAARPDFWSKTWIPPADQAKGDETWNTLAPAYLRSQFAVAAP
jgi:hypothetical protein